MNPAVALDARDRHDFSVCGTEVGRPNAQFQQSIEAARKGLAMTKGQP
jgi:hypothetical protein